MAKWVYLVLAKCEAKDEATQQAIKNFLLNKLETEKASGNVITGNVTDRAQEINEVVEHSQNI